MVEDNTIVSQYFTRKQGCADGGAWGASRPPQCLRNGKKVGHKTDPLTCIRKHDQI